jgi:type VI protein secretion system component VasA
VFTTIEHWNAELPGHHVCKRGDRLAAYEPVAQAVNRIFGSTQADAARGVELRHDHGSQYLTDYFQGQSRFHGFTPSFAFVGAKSKWVRPRNVETVLVFHKNPIGSRRRQADCEIWRQDETTASRVVD